jgi:hypothetical protein
MNYWEKYRHPEKPAPKESQEKPSNAGPSDKGKNPERPRTYNNEGDPDQPNDRRDPSPDPSEPSDRDDHSEESTETNYDNVRHNRRHRRIEMNKPDNFYGDRKKIKDWLYAITRYLYFN